MSSTGVGEVHVVTDETFEKEILKNDMPVLVDFWAQWCPPCHMIAPMLAEIARERSDSLILSKINADENPTTARNYKVMSLPTLMLFRHGQPVQAIVGARSKAQFLSELDAALRVI